MKIPLVRMTLLTISFFIIQNIFCQENLKPCYIIDLKGDTLKGYIDYKIWIANPKKISYLKTPANECIIYTPLDIKKFLVFDDVYESGIINFDESSSIIENLSTTAKIALKSDTVFLQTLISGEKSLYSYQNKNNDTYFFTKDGSSFVYLINKIYKKDINGKPSIAYNKRYINQLSLLLKDCPEIKNKIIKTKYSRNELIKLFEKYNNCVGKEISYKKEKRKLNLEIGIISGISITKLKLKDNYDSKSDINFNSSKNITTGVFCNFRIFRNQEKWSISNELVFSEYKFSGNSYYKNLYGDFKETYKLFEFQYIKLNSALRYKQSIGNFSIFSNGGTTIGYSLKSKNLMRTHQKELGIESTFESEAVNEISKYEFGINFGVGISYKKLSIELRGEQTLGFSSTPLTTTHINRISLIAGYKF